MDNFISCLLFFKIGLVGLDDAEDDEASHRIASINQNMK